MRKLMYFATALLVLAGCNKKENALNNAPEGAPFKKGQQVTLTVGTGDNNQAAPRKVAGLDNTTENRIDFTWEEGDKILVKVGDKTAEFTLSSEPDLNEGEFVGTMPADGSTFDIQYPTTTPDLSAQVYTTTKTIPADKMLFTATGCTLGESAFLAAQNAMVQLNLYGTDKTIGKIVFTNKTAEPDESYTLTCGGVAIGAISATATPFYMVVPAGEYQFEAEIWDNATTPAMICSFATSAAKTFTAGGCLNMPAKEVKEPFVPTYVDLGLSVKWATCNLGATKPEEYGDHFAWGETEPYYVSQSPLIWKTDKTTGYNWQSYCGAAEFTEWSTVPYDANGVLKPEFDVATVKWGGTWRMPTVEEVEELMDNCTFVWTADYNDTGVGGVIVTGPNDESFFLPADGYYIGTSFIINLAYDPCCYWCSDSDGSSIANNFLVGEDGDLFIYPNQRFYGYLVRPVCPKE